MREAAKKFEFEKAAQLRDRIKSLKQQDLAGVFGKDSAEAPPANVPEAELVAQKGRGLSCALSERRRPRSHEAAAKKPSSRG